MSDSELPLGPMPRRAPLVVESRYTYPTQMKRTLRPRIAAPQVLLRSLAWTLAALRYSWRLRFDALRKKATPRQRGVRFRQMFEEMGGTAIKLGQQLAVRVDLLPFEVCDELGQLMDNVPPFEVEHAIRKIEETCGRPMHEIFRVFDPEPIGSASIACVYQAVLLTGEKVAVKVRRPEVDRLFGLDLHCLDWLTHLAEFLAIVPPGNFKYLRTEMRSMLQEELDFDDEARYQRLFRRITKKRKIKWLSAPKVYDAYSGPEVLVGEFVSGIWCKELLAAVESGDPALLRQVRRMDLDPKKIARRLYGAFLFGFFEAPFFHGDPHPANIILRPGNKIVLLDFGACGSMSREYIRSYDAMMDRMTVGDLSGMADASLRMMEPLPHVNVDELKKRIEFLYRRHLRAVEDKKAEWWERTSTAMWLAMIEAVRDFNLPMNLDAVRISRASMLYDTVIYRLHRKFDVRREYHRYRRDAADRAVRQIKKERKRASSKLARKRAIQEHHDQMSRLRHLTYQMESSLAQLPLRFTSSITKGAYAARLTVKLFISIGVLLVIFSLLAVGHHVLAERGMSDLEMLIFVERYFLNNPLALLIVIPPLWIFVRRMLFRLSEVDVHQRK